MTSAEIVALMTPVQEFVEDKMEGEDTNIFTLAEARDVWMECKTDYVLNVVVRALKLWGMKQDPRDAVHRKVAEKRNRAATYSTNRHTRWQDCPSHGGSGMSYGTWVGAGNTSHKPG